MGSGPAPVELGVWTAPRPAPAAELAMSVSFVNPPAAEIARRVLPRVIRRGGPANRGSVRAALHEAWVSEHKVVTEKPGPVPKLRSDQKSLSSRTICARIGRCVCENREILQCRASLVRTVKSKLPKKSIGRGLYDSNKVVLHITQLVGSRANHVSQYFFVGFGNLSDLTFTVQRMELATACVDPVMCLESELGTVLYSDGSPPVEIYEVVHALRLQRGRFNVEILAVRPDAEEIMPVFRPCLVVAPSSIAACQFWPPLKAAKGPPPPPRPLLALEDIPSAEVDEAGAGDAGILEHPDQDPLLQAEVNAWELTSSDEEPAAPPRAPRPPRAPAARAARASDAAPRAPVVPSPAGPEGGASAIRAAAEQRVVCNVGGPRVIRVERWPRLVHTEFPDGSTSWLRISSNVGEIGFGNFRARCGICGATLDKSGRRHRPLGELWSWLSLCPGERHTHREAPSASFGDRAAARRALEQVPDAREFLEGEAGGVGLGEPQESFRP